MRSNDIDVLNLNEWLIRHNVNKESEEQNFKKLFYNMDLKMKKLHRKGYYIDSFKGEDILIQGNNVEFNSLKKMYQEDSDYIIRKNIYFSAVTAISIYCSCMINPNSKAFLKENFNEFAFFIPDDNKPYYRGIIERESKVYLSDYMDAKIKRDIEKESENLGEGINNSRQLNKSTMAGRLLNDESNSSIAGYALIYAFAGIIFLLAILIPLLIIIATR